MPNAAAGMTILPQYQGDYYTLQNKQALAQALMQTALQPQQIQATGSGPYTVMPKYSVGAGIAQLGQALLAAKMQQQTAQGYQALGQNQMEYLMGSPSAAPQQAAQQTPSDVGSSAGMGGAGATPDSLAQALSSSVQNGGAQPAAAPQRTGGLLSPGSAMNPSGMDVGKAAFLYQAMGPAEYAKEFVAPYVKPTEATLTARQAGMTPGGIQQANAGALFHNNFVAPITGTGTFRDPHTMQPMAFNPDIPAGSTPLFDATGNVAAVRPIQGAQGVMQGNASATAAGEGSQLPYDKGVDSQGNPLPVTNRTAVANQAGATTPASAAIVQTESNGNPNAVSPKGAVGAWQVMPNTKTDPGFGVAPAANNSPAELNRVGRDYYNAMTQRYGSPTLGAIAYNMGPGATDTWLKNGAKFEDLPQETRNYIGKVSTLTALNSGAGAPQGSGAIYGAAPLAAQATAEAQSRGAIDTMQKSYQNLQTVRSGAPAALQDVDNMKQLAQGANPLTIGPAAAKFAGLFSANAAEYEKSRDNLVTNLGSQLGINSDAARDLVYGSIPSYGAPKTAVQNGLETLRGQIQTRLLKSNYLSDAYANGDAKAYNVKENQFDQNVTPAIANVVSMPSGPQRAAALTQAKQNPQLRVRLEWAAQNGVLQ